MYCCTVLPCLQLCTLRYRLPSEDLFVDIVDDEDVRYCSPRAASCTAPRTASHTAPALLDACQRPPSCLPSMQTEVHCLTPAYHACPACLLQADV
jgi:hypothetical protein